MPNDLLITQSFVVSEAGSYWDYRDYLLSLRSNLNTVADRIRLNLERGQEFLPEFEKVANKYNFKDFSITATIPNTWADYMLEQINEAKTYWTMPWPGDHIYINPNPDLFGKTLAMGKKLGADAVAYGHTQDWEYFLDWNRIKVLYNDADYVMIYWGHKYKYCRNPRLGKAAKKTITASLLMTPVPGFITYTSSFFKKILEALPAGTKRWQDMEFSPANEAWKYKLLIPKQYLYRHVHGYWFEGFMKYYNKSKMPAEVDKEIKSWYIPTNYDSKIDSPNPKEYLDICLQRHPYIKRYFIGERVRDAEGMFGRSPFDSDWKAIDGLFFSISNIVMSLLYDWPRRLASNFLKSNK
ncbi:MAG: hypothetical protein HY918_01075 [Candidatus Doudnabacteria bacterium]|nr:hypothetical protein [Candidatus Doudnabacteria bacterium]